MPKKQKKVKGILRVKKPKNKIYRNNLKINIKIIFNIISDKYDCNKIEFINLKIITILALYKYFY